MNIKEQIAAVKQALADKQKQLADHLGGAIEKGITPDEEQEQAIKSLEAEIEVLEKNLSRLNKLDEAAEKAARSAVPTVGDNAESGTKSLQGMTVEVNLPPGIAFAQYARAKLAAQISAKKGNPITAYDAAKMMGFNEDVAAYARQKALLGTTTQTGFAAELAQPDKFTAEFVELLRKATVFDKMAGMRNVPFNVKIASQVTGGSSQWVGEGAKKPVTNPTFGSVEVKQHKLAAITVYTEELLRRADPAIDVLVRDDLIASVAELIDATFLDNVAGSDVRPAGIMHQAENATIAGSTAADIEAALLEMVGYFAEQNMTADGCYFVMSETRAMQLALMRDALGNSYFSGLNFAGTRSLLGIPVLTTQAAGSKILLIKASEILVAQDGGIDVSYSDQATIADDSGTMHNLWQENKVAVRVEKFITWTKRRPVVSVSAGS